MRREYDRGCQDERARQKKRRLEVTEREREREGGGGGGEQKQRQTKGLTARERGERGGGGRTCGGRQQRRESEERERRRRLEKGRHRVCMRACARVCACLCAHVHAHVCVGNSTWTVITSWPVTPQHMNWTSEIPFPSLFCVEKGASGERWGRGGGGGLSSDYVNV